MTARTLSRPHPVPRPYPWYGWLGLALLLVAELLLFLRVEPVPLYFYVLAWWPYILAADALVYRLRGESLLVSRTREFFWLALWSAAVWYFFELVNVRLDNWHYVNVPDQPVVRFALGVLAFATVLPGMFVTFELVTLWDWLGRWRSRPFQTPRWVMRGGFTFGLLCLALPLLWPQYFFGLIWGFAPLVLEPWLYRRGGRSLLRDLERGDPRPLARLLLTGLICGLLWEFWNYWARTKWIYTVPFIGEVKLFEMPVLGFIGFPPFTVACYVFYNALALLRGGRTWESREPTTGKHVWRAETLWTGLAVAAALVAFMLGVHLLMETYTLRSTTPSWGLGGLGGA